MKGIQLHFTAFVVQGHHTQAYLMAERLGPPDRRAVP